MVTGIQAMALRHKRQQHRYAARYVLPGTDSTADGRNGKHDAGDLATVVSSSFRPVTSALTIPLLFCGHSQKLVHRPSGEV